MGENKDTQRIEGEEGWDDCEGVGREIENLRSGEEWWKEDMGEKGRDREDWWEIGEEKDKTSKESEDED